MISIEKKRLVALFAGTFLLLAAGNIGASFILAGLVTFLLVPFI